ncbi:MAG: 4Fe-4S binding protein [Candidatus Methanoplasma sp.]|nr:4Fe-4S binding protein [Candidatus Methanoplasma sp.]
MYKEDLADIVGECVFASEKNRIPPDAARVPNIAGIRIFDRPIFGIADAGDPLFESFKDPLAIGSQYRTPQEWLPGARSVITYFFPFSEEIRKSNRRNGKMPSDEWLHGRIEGQELIVQFSKYLCGLLEERHYRSVSPSADPSFVQYERTENGRVFFESSWSERHAAYAAGLGTFGLSGGLITVRGTAGRLGSVITALKLEPDLRLSDDIYGNCSLCLACASVCPAGAISKEGGKDSGRCSRYLMEIKAQYDPYYGCGKCQTGVPCENRIPAGRKYNRRMFQCEIPKR